ncbi:hypothetical protein H2204_008668 [Knufia peltigerae]|uniref:Uncharacterized protein n=1 Tax=Knufia peltigerae TaxID=1002370 RepID=A0AA38XZG8_9EURO|nr:hypothetical protein H2204_008668 [Knufia peltigerae]
MSHQDPSEAISKTLQELEHLLSEAVKLAGSAGIVDGNGREEDWKQETTMLTSPTSGKSCQPSEKEFRGKDGSLDGDGDGLRSILPDPMVEQQHGRTTGTSPADQVRQPSKLPGPSRTSFRRKSTQGAGSKRTCIRPSPIIRLDDIDLNDDGSDERGKLLGAHQNSDMPRAGHERHFTNMFGVHSRQGSLNMAHPD